MATTEGLKVWTNTKVAGVYSVGFAAVVVAADAEAAAKLLQEAVTAKGMKREVKAADMRLVYTDSPYAMVLVDGNY